MDTPADKQFRAQAEAGPSRPSTPLPLRRLAHPPRASTPLSTPLHTSTTHISDPLRPEIITTAQEFQDHFHALTLSTEHEQDSLYRDQLGEISGLREKCEELLGILEGAGEGVGEMMRALEYVEERSESLRGACEDLLEEQVSCVSSRWRPTSARTAYWSSQMGRACELGLQLIPRPTSSRTPPSSHTGSPSLHSSKRLNESSITPRPPWFSPRTSYRC